MKTLRVGLYGGTFSPPHKGHINAAREFERQMCLDLLYIMPANIPPHKAVVNPVPPEVRLEMCRLAFDGISDTEVSDYEISREGVSYTVDTLSYLTERYGKIFMLCGDDMLLTLDKWREPERIFEMAHIVCMRRYETDAQPLLEKADEYRRIFGAEISFIGSAAVPVSSTEIRAMIKNGDGTVGELIVPSVYEYIKENRLYMD